MKTICIIIALIFPVLLFSQEVFEKTFDLSGNKKVDLNLKFADNIIITKSTDNKMYFKSTVLINDGELNHAHKTKIDEDEFEIEIETSLDEKILKNVKTEKKDDDCDSYFSSDCYRICADIKFEIQIPANTSLTLETISGNIELRGIQGAVNIKSISGFVDISWGNVGADLKLKTITGEIYSNLELNNMANKEQSFIGSNITAEYNGGGVPVKIETISSDIFVRKE